MKWYLKNSDGKVFGPVDTEKFQTWARDGRIEPFAGISNDLKTWRLASLEPLLEMDWLIENEPGRFYGPTHRAVVDDLVNSGSVSATCRIYRDDHGGAAEKELAAARAEAEKTATEARAEAEKAVTEARTEAEKAMAEVQAEAEKAMAELKAEAERSLAAKDAEIAALKESEAALKTRAERSEARTAELEEKISKLTESRRREWQAEVLEPEILPGEPPAAVRDVFRPDRPHTLADLERQAQVELARMGTAGARKFFGIKK